MGGDGLQATEFRAEGGVARTRGPGHRRMKASKGKLKAVLARGAEAGEMAAAWCKQGVDPLFLQYLVWTVKEEGRAREERVLDSQIRLRIEAAGRHLAKAIAELRRIPRLAFAAAFIGKEVLQAFCHRIEAVKANLAVLGGRRRPRRRPEERHIGRFMFVLSEHLRERTGRPHQGEIAQFVNELGLGKGLTDRHVQIRCLQYRRIEPDALEKAREESRRFWEG